MGINVDIFQYPEWLPRSSRKRLYPLIRDAERKMQASLTQLYSSRPHSDWKKHDYDAALLPLIICSDFIGSLWLEFSIETDRLAVLNELWAFSSNAIADGAIHFLNDVFRTVCYEYYPAFEELSYDDSKKVCVLLASHVNQHIHWYYDNRQEPARVAQAVRHPEMVLPVFNLATNSGANTIDPQATDFAFAVTEEDVLHAMFDAETIKAARAKVHEPGPLSAPDVHPNRDQWERVRQLHDRVRHYPLTVTRLAELLGSNETDTYCALRGDPRRGKSAREKLPAVLTQLETELLAEETVSNVPNMFQTCLPVSIAKPKRNSLNTSCEQQAPDRTPQNQSSTALSTVAG